MISDAGDGEVSFFDRKMHSSHFLFHFRLIFYDSFVFIAPNRKSSEHSVQSCTDIKYYRILIDTTPNIEQMFDFNLYIVRIMHPTYDIRSFYR